MNTSAISRVITFALGGLTLLAVIVLFAWSVLDEVRFASERMGVYVSETERGVLVEDLDPGLPAEAAGIQVDDLMVRIGQHDIEQVSDFAPALERFHRPGEPLTVTLLRDGVELEVQLVPGTAPDVARLLAQALLVAAYLGLAILAASYRGRDIRARLLMVFVALVAVEMAMPVGFTLPETALVTITLAWMLLTGMQIAVELHLVSLIPRPLGVLRRQPSVTASGFYLVGALAGIGLAATALYQWLATGVMVTDDLATAQSAVLVGWAVIIPSILVWQAWHSRNARERNQAMLVLLGVLPWVVYMLVSTFWAGWAEFDRRWALHAEDAVLLFFPIAVFIAIFRFGLIDVEQLVRRSVVYSVVAALVIVLVYLLLTSALPWFTERLDDSVGLWLVTAMALMTGILFRPLRHAVEQLVERGLFPERRAMRNRLIEAAAALSDEAGMDKLVQRLADDARDALDLNWTAVAAIAGPNRESHAAFSEGLDTRRSRKVQRLLGTDSRVFSRLSREQRPMRVRRLRRLLPDDGRILERLGAEVLVPLYFQRRMIGILCLSSKRSGELFVREELELLNLFSHQVAASLENLRLFQDATYEELTGLLRREAVLRHLKAECARAVRDAQPLSVFMIDLDHFKAVNDTHGHLFGDLILKRVSEVMFERIRAADSLGRYGGEEFLLVLPDTDLEGARELASVLRRAIFDLDFKAPDGESDVRVTVSIGIATARATQCDPGQLADSLLAQADAALYEAKKAGRNRITIHAEATANQPTAGKTTNEDSKPDRG